MPAVESAERVCESVFDCIGNTPLVALRRLFDDPGVEVLAKLELLNPGGSMKDRSARHIVEAGLRDGSIVPGSRLVESSSGNFGVALAIAARIHGLRFTCVVDPKTTVANLAILRGLGADVEVVTEHDHAGGYLHSRIRRVKELLADAPGAIWVNQYANEGNWQAYYHGTGAELVEQLVLPPAYLFAAVGTTGSILGCSRRLREHFPDLRVIAVDAVGSVIFGGPPGPRELPGIGSGRVPELCRPEEVDEVIHVDDVDAALGCRELLTAEGIFAGGSSGAVVAAIARSLPALPRPCRIVAIFPDRGDRYVDLVYDDGWLAAARARRGPAPAPSIATERDADGNPRLLYLSRRDVEAVGGGRSDLYVEALRGALAAHADGRTVQPLKPYLRADADGGHIADRLIAMPAHLGEPGVSGLKWIGSKHDNPAAAGLERASAVIVLNDPRTNYPIAILEGSLISAWRTASVTCLGMEHLARDGFAAVALVGCGVIGRTHVTALLERFDGIATIDLFDARTEAARDLAALLRARRPDVAVRVAGSAEDAVRAGEVVIACTVTDRPYLPLAWLRPGALLCNVSVMDAGRDVFLGADKVVVDDWEQCTRERKVIHQLVLDGAFSRERLHAELGEIVGGRRPGRERDDEIILLHPMGIAVADVACAAEVYLRARRQGVGTWLDLY
jgi:cysteine synthase A